ncbi:hypothetical protein BFG04_03785 [Campylobacter pinnipediorum subsp. pinnipediorum]|uniref:Uncharacterized protein n=1 Tax=Campylobacter pinnipediorum subsp. pinnipediorum TaxID=1660067 RepID=A0AAX0LB54_9BACT|nr:hypothetical protein [Campylobacter pinnipediorum]OPA77226.1 hypothetical protein BFG04_03785 [Campylobacter pinnipediorum subsp. pinnipediorum]
MINFLSSYSTLIVSIVFLIALFVYHVKTQRDENLRIYLAQRQEEVSRISDGVADGILTIFTNEAFLQSLKDGAYIQININVDGSRNIIIAGDKNTLTHKIE